MISADRFTPRRHKRQRHYSPIAPSFFATCPLPHFDYHTTNLCLPACRYLKTLPPSLRSRVRLVPALPAGCTCKPDLGTRTPLRLPLWNLGNVRAVGYTGPTAADMRTDKRRETKRAQKGCGSAGNRSSLEPDKASLKSELRSFFGGFPKHERCLGKKKLLLLTADPAVVPYLRCKPAPYYQQF